MKMSQFNTIALIPFGGRRQAELGIESIVERRGPILQIAYTVQGRLGDVRIPPPAVAAERRDGLWESTCLECFLAADAEEMYREFNFSPAGHWNVYRFDAYRRGMREEDLITAMPMEMLREPHALHLSTCIDLKSLKLDQAAIRVGLSAVIEFPDRRKSYWAPAHPGTRPDFHYRDAFIVKMDA
jgi:hypothetical protein